MIKNINNFRALLNEIDIPFEDTKSFISLIEVLDEYQNFLIEKLGITKDYVETIVDVKMKKAVFENLTLLEKVMLEIPDNDELIKAQIAKVIKDNKLDIGLKRIIEKSFEKDSDFENFDKLVEAGTIVTEVFMLVGSLKNT